MSIIKPFSSEYGEYLRDESRSTGEAESISFPATEDDVRSVLRELYATGTPVTVQAARTGLAAGAVPHGGHVLNTSRMNRVLGMERDGDGRFCLRAQPGVVLLELRKQIHAKNFATESWDAASKEAFRAFRDAPEQFFPTDPTEASACLGGMAACNASGARSYAYGPMRPHIKGIRVVLADGEVVALERGQVHADGRDLCVPCEGGRLLSLRLPDYDMPRTKNASGYYVADGMDAIDLFIGACGTLGVITELTVALTPAPAVVWGVSCFLPQEAQALEFTAKVRNLLAHAAALEYFDGAALDILRRQRAQAAAFASLPEPPDDARSCVYIELDCDDEVQAQGELCAIGDVLGEVGGSEDETWVARTDADRERQQFFRHAVPESVNMLIDERRRTDPAITKLGSDMSVPDDRLFDVVALYRRTLAEVGLQSASWGHIGNNHLHVNILPRDVGEYRRGGELFAAWAHEVTSMGGAVSAEHGVGKLKRDFLTTMYGRRHIEQMAALKLQLDPKAQLGRGNLFSEDVLEQMAAKVAKAGA